MWEIFEALSQAESTSKQNDEIWALVVSYFCGKPDSQKQSLRVIG